MADETDSSSEKIVAEVLLGIFAVLSVLVFVAGLLVVFANWEDIRLLAELNPTRGRIDVIIEELPGAFWTMVIGGSLFLLSLFFLAISD